MSSEGEEAVRVKVIVTRFVETDADCFKSVVQDLTGRHSTFAERDEEGGLGGQMMDNHHKSYRMASGRKVEEFRGGGRGGAPRGVTTVGDLMRWAEQQLPLEDHLR